MVAVRGPRPPPAAVARAPLPPPPANLGF
jgi:hypothetical protein